MKTIRFGILSTAKIARTKVIPALQQGEYTTVDAICSRNEESARAAADELSIPKSYGSYEAMLNDPDIDAVYVPLPNHLHVKWSINAMAAGKHVLCEKPIGLDTEDANKLIDATSRYPHLKVMEGFMYRFHPQWIEAKRLVDEGEIGDLVTIQSFFSYFNDDPNNIRNMAAIGGGGLMDIGCYSISLSRFLFNAEPTRCCGFADRDPEFGTDRLFSGMMDFNGKVSTFTCSTQLSPYQRVNILGTDGRIEILIPFNAPPNAPTQIIVQRDRLEDEEDRIRTTTFGVCDQYTLQGDAFAKSIIDDTPVPTPLTDAWANMHTLEVLIESAGIGQWVVC
ncbi:putative enzyme [Pseudodesulfovibrio profundus]|uniref:Putative enzyme n=1 Tax=Pseudodesulfovibrio profundus TaxID=57320 RepID=A0A2C8FB44_9BACT|nr:Gfo/Idh/MocA family oxidoreductase [Pseudodesulfovibrio profundus]MBC15751.1 NAD-binding protein [Desulfovibrio sp.]SOB59657.1 putative enzyme [Pseudodesulfovibrio profundus]|tara:strand:+ start:2065 stop:3072 length:1008 start_codon:yes stop_codon:yes gene_type:complete